MQGKKGGKIWYNGKNHHRPDTGRKGTCIMYLCKEFREMEPLDGGFLIHTNCADIKVCFVTDEIVRIRVSFDREMAEESYVLATTAWADRLDGLFAGERTRLQPVEPRLHETKEGYVFVTPAVLLEFCKDPLGFKLYNREGDLLYSDLAGTPTPWIPTAASPITAP